jgi:hypothetical protein
MADTTHMIAANGHTMEYRITGYEEDGRPKVSQWDAVHSDRCRCLESDEE